MTPALHRHALTRQNVAWPVAIALALGLALVAVFVAPIMLAVVPMLVVAGLALLRWPWLGVALLVASVPAQQAGAVSGLTLTRAALVATGAGLVIWWTAGRRPIVATRLIWPFVALIAWMLVTTFVARDLGAASADLFRWSVALFAFFAALQVLIKTSERLLTAIIVAVAIAGAIEAGVGAALGLLGFGPESFVIDDAFARAYGTFGRPNTFAGYLEMAFFPVLWLGLYRLRDLNDRLRGYIVARRAGFTASAAQRRDLLLATGVTTILLGSAAVMLAGIAISFSRGGWLGLSAGLVVTVLIAVRRYWRLVLPAIPVVMLLGLTALAAFAPATLTERVSSISEEARPFDAASIPITPENFAVVERMAHWQAGWHMFEDHPVTG
ncbi:MAG TPA: O-antigen ligase family protein, partial [Thermomicrobiales bacterium]|nr:O-antigen ligase family protein [Thermomicrobiales bacterium]